MNKNLMYIQTLLLYSIADKRLANLASNNKETEQKQAKSDHTNQKKKRKTTTTQAATGLLYLWELFFLLLRDIGLCHDQLVQLY